MKNLIGEQETSLRDIFAEWGAQPYRVHQVFNWVYHRGVKTFDEMTNLSKDLRNEMACYFHLSFPKIAKKTPSSDGSIKYLFELDDGALVESIWMPSGPRKTLCLSSQVGCRLGCSFCLTASMGLRRQLTAAEIIGQYMAINEDHPQEEKITNIVFMGMGEPLDNYDAVVDALRLMISPQAMRISTRKITVSTAGLVDKINQFKEENLHVNLAISLNATEDETRDRIMPINKKYPLRTLLDCLREYPLKPTRRLTFEYVLLKDVNDSMEDAVRLARLLRGIPSKINIIPFNSFEDSGYAPPPEETILEFQNYLISKNYSVFIRQNRGGDILGACGQLAAKDYSPALTN